MPWPRGLLFHSNFLFRGPSPGRTTAASPMWRAQYRKSPARQEWRAYRAGQSAIWLGKQKHRCNFCEAQWIVTL